MSAPSSAGVPADAAHPGRTPELNKGEGGYILLAEDAAFVLQPMEKIIRRGD